jgi:hypothetical protein
MPPLRHGNSRDIPSARSGKNYPISGVLSPIRDERCRAGLQWGLIRLIVMRRCRVSSQLGVSPARWGGAFHRPGVPAQLAPAAALRSQHRPLRRIPAKTCHRQEPRRSHAMPETTLRQRHLPTTAADPQTPQGGWGRRRKRRRSFPARPARPAASSRGSHFLGLPHSNPHDTRTGAPRGNRTPSPLNGLAPQAMQPNVCRSAD